MEDLDTTRHLFQVQIKVNDLVSFINCNKFLIRSQFANVFSVVLDETTKEKRNVRKGKLKGKTKTVAVLHQTVVFESTVHDLISYMQMYPIEFALSSPLYPDYKIGSACVRWHETCFDYLYNLENNLSSPPASFKGTYNVFDEYTSRRMAVMKLDIELSYTTATANANNNTYESYVEQISSPKRTGSECFTDETGTIKTIYYEGKKKYKLSSRHSSKAGTGEKAEIKPTNVISEEKQLVINTDNSSTNLIQNQHNEVNTEKPFYDTKSCSTINKDNENSFNNQVYVVGYCSVNNKADSKTPSCKSCSSNSQANISSQGSSQKLAKGFIKSEVSFHVPKPPALSCSVCGKDSIDSESEGDNLAISKAFAIEDATFSKVECLQKNLEIARRQPKADDRTLLDLTNLTAECCVSTEHITTEITKTIQFKTTNLAPCMCECECTIDIYEKTTYCQVCGGYETIDQRFLDEQTEEQLNTLFPCPIYHKLGAVKKVEDKKSKKKKKKQTDQQNAAGAADAEKKKSFGSVVKRYDYKVPHMGRRGLTGPRQMPKNMGWLWNSEKTAGLKFAKGWRPGAISKSLLRKLNKAKTKTLPVEQVKIPKKVTKKRAKDKPTLIISKINGEFRIEMQASPESDNNDEQFSPLIYKIKTEDNDEKVQKYERRKQHLIKKAIDKVWKDPYHPEICEKTCLRAYKQAVGLLPYDPENPECICSNEKVNTQHQSSSSVTFNSSHDSSLDVQWEIHFTPPSAYNKIVE